MQYKSGGMLLIGEPYECQVPATEEIALASGASSLADFLTLADLVSSYDALGYDLVEMVLATRKVGTATKRRNGSPCAIG